MESEGIFDDVRVFPDAEALRIYKGLIGLDEIKTRLTKEAIMLLDRGAIDRWQKNHHPKCELKVVDLFRNRPPLFILAGDVGTGKTALAESFSDPIARNLKIEMTLYALSLNARGTGAVGQMTTLISSALAEVRDEAKRLMNGVAKSRSGVVLLIDEADALAQSRETNQMHHEDRAGVNALIRGVDDLATGRLPAIVVLCTNRLDALDPAVRRRAAATFEFKRPNEEQRCAILKSNLDGLGLSDRDFELITKETGPINGRSYGHTYSDLTQRLLPSILLRAFPDGPITADLIHSVVAQTDPTPPFQSHDTQYEN